MMENSLKKHLPINCVGTGFEQLRLDELTQAQLAQYNKFIENGFKN